MRVVKPWHRLPRHVVDAPSLEPFKVRLDGALSNFIQLKMSLFTAEGLDQMALKGHFQPKPFYGSIRLCPVRGNPQLGLGRDYLLEKKAGSPRRRHSEQ